MNVNSHLRYVISELNEVSRILLDKKTTSCLTMPLLNGTIVLAVIVICTDVQAASGIVPPLALVMTFLVYRYIDSQLSFIMRAIG